MLLASRIPAAAQGRLAWDAAPPIGSWAEMALTIDEDGKTSTGTLRVSCLARQRVGGVDHLWIEVSRVKGKKQRILKLLLPEEAVASSDTPLAAAVEVVYQDSGKAALKASGAQLASLVGILETIQGETPLTHRADGREEVTLPDGKKVTALKKSGSTEMTFPGKEPTRVESEVWTVKDVPFGVAKRTLTTTEGSGEIVSRKVETTVLTRYGKSGATSEIKGEIRPFNVLELLSGR